MTDTTEFKPEIMPTVPLAVVAQNMADEFLSAIHSGINRKNVYGLEEGDELDNVVDHYLQHDGMADDLHRLSRIRLQVALGVDISGSMFKRKYGRAIVPAMTMLRMFHMCFQQVRESLPPEVFRYSTWLWSAWAQGKHTVCLDNLRMGTFVPSELEPYAWTKKIVDPTPLTPMQIDLFLENCSLAEQPDYRGTGTALTPLIRSLGRWEENYGDPRAHRLDIVITDGKFYDGDDSSDASLAQLERRSSGRYEGVIFQIGKDSNLVPEGYTLFHTRPQYLDAVVREFLLDFVQKVM